MIGKKTFVFLLLYEETGLSVNSVLQEPNCAGPLHAEGVRRLQTRLKTAFPERLGLPPVVAIDRAVLRIGAELIDMALFV